MSQFIKFHSILYKNFLSSGNNPIKILLDRSPSTIITGSNGFGKSTVIEAITFALYGKSYRGINKPNLINTINQKDCYTEIEFFISSDRYKICRGIKPNIFDIFINDVKLDNDAATRDQQKYLETFILKIPFKAFSQIVVIGSATYTPFMKLNASSRREVVETFLDISVYGDMFKILKGRIQNWKSNINDLTNEILKEESNLSILVSSMNSTKNSINTDTYVEKINKLNEQIENNVKEVKSLKVSLEKYENIKEKLFKDSYNKILYETKKELIKLETIAEQTDTEIQSVQSNTFCSYCKQDIPEDHKHNICSELVNDSVQNWKLVYEIRFKIEELETKLEREIECTNKINSLKNEIENFKTKTKHLLSEKKNVEVLKDNLDRDIQTNISNLETEKLLIENTIKKLKSKIDNEKNMKPIYDHMFSLLKDDGIKASIIKYYIPLINKYTNYFLSKLNFNLQFELDENFNESLKSRYKNEFSYSNFSEGERQRLDLSIMMMWIEISKIKNSINTNLLILDETFDSSLDANGVDDLISILDFMGNSGKNIFVISHNKNIPEKFFSNIEFEKNNGFSQIKNTALQN